MQFGAMNFPVLPVLEEIEAIGRLGFDYVELAMDPPMAHYRVIAANKNDIVNALGNNGLDLVCHMPTFVSTADLTESIRRASVTEMHRSLELAIELGASKVVLHPSVVSGLGSFVMDTVRGYAYEFLQEITAAAGGMEICLENMFPRYMSGVEPHDFEEIFREFPSLKLTLDTGHANIDDKSGKRLLHLAENFGERIGHLHISDNRGRRDDNFSVGKGSIDFDELIRQLQQIGYDSTVTFEVFEEDRQMLVDSRERIKEMFLR